MRTIQSILAAACLFGLGASGAGAATLPAFPGAEGFGAGATGGRGGEVYHVTSLEDPAKPDRSPILTPGTFRDAVSKPNRTIVFDVGGYIELNSIVSASSNLTIAGQTAPGQGVGVVNYEVSFSDCDNVIVRYFRFRQGVNNVKSDKKYAIAVKGKNVIIDHCSIQWGRWDCIGMSDANGVTFQYCIIGEGVAPQRFGGIVQSDNITFSHNLWTNNQSRNPKVKGKIQYINNVVYNWGVTGLAGGHSAADHYLDAIGNYFIKGPTSNDKYAGGFTETDKVYEAGNVVDLTADGKLDGRAAVQSEWFDEKRAGATPAPDPDDKADDQPAAAQATAEKPAAKPAGAANEKAGPTFMPKPYLTSPIPVTIHPAEEALRLVLDGAGCSLSRDVVDERLVDEVRSFGTKGKRIKDPAESGGVGTIVGGEAPKDTDRDGIPDAWESAHKLNPNDPKDGSTVDASGYSMLEVYFNGLVAKAAAAR